MVTRGKSNSEEGGAYFTTQLPQTHLVSASHDHPEFNSHASTRGSILRLPEMGNYRSRSGWWVMWSTVGLFKFTDEFKQSYLSKSSREM